MQVVAWVDMNTNLYVGEYTSRDTDDYWCPNCEKHVKPIESIKDDDEDY